MSTDNRMNAPTPEQIEAVAKAIGITVINPQGAARFGWEDITEADKALYMRGARAALVAAQGARQPSEDDDTAFEAGMDEVDWDMVRDGVGDPQEAAGVAVRAALEARAAVPDAATEQPDGELAACSELRAYWRSKAIEARAERDAALAAVERVHGILNRDDFGDSWEHDDWVYRDAAEKKLSEIEAALDGAPEPEWEYGLLNPQAPDGGKPQGGAHLISENREHIIAQQRRGHPAIRAVRRRKAGPWLPIAEEER